MLNNKAYNFLIEREKHSDDTGSIYFGNSENGVGYYKKYEETFDEDEDKPNFKKELRDFKKEYKILNHGKSIYFEVGIDSLGGSVTLEDVKIDGDEILATVKRENGDKDKEQIKLTPVD